jgi:hypothetical protein
MKMAATIWSATESKVVIESTEIDGLQSIEYKVNRSRSDIVAIGQGLRQGVEYGVKVINGKLRVKSSCSILDEKLNKTNMEDAKFTMTANLKKGNLSKTISFQECYLDDREFSMEINGVGIATYTFSAMDVQES